MKLKVNNITRKICIFSLAILLVLLFPFSLISPEKAYANDELNAVIQTNQIDQGTLTSSKWSGLDTEGASWYNHCSKWYSKYNKTSDTENYTFNFDFSSPWIQRGMPVLEFQI